MTARAKLLQLTGWPGPMETLPRAQREPCAVPTHDGGQTEPIGLLLQSGESVQWSGHRAGSMSPREGDGAPERGHCQGYTQPQAHPLL